MNNDSFSFLSISLLILQVNPTFSETRLICNVDSLAPAVSPRTLLPLGGASGLCRLGPFLSHRSAMLAAKFFQLGSSYFLGIKGKKEPAVKKARVGRGAKKSVVQCSKSLWPRTPPFISYQWKHSRCKGPEPRESSVTQSQTTGPAVFTWAPGAPLFRSRPCIYLGIPAAPSLSQLTEQGLPGAPCILPSTRACSWADSGAAASEVWGLWGYSSDTWSKDKWRGLRPVPWPYFPWDRHAALDATHTLVSALRASVGRQGGYITSQGHSPGKTRPILPVQHVRAGESNELLQSHLLIHLGTASKQTHSRAWRFYTNRSGSDRRSKSQTCALNVQFLQSLLETQDKIKPEIAG